MVRGWHLNLRFLAFVLPSLSLELCHMRNVMLPNGYPVVSCVKKLGPAASVAADQIPLVAAYLR